MPAPDKATIRAALIDSLLSDDGPGKPFFRVENGVKDGGKLPEEMENFVDRLATGIAKFWSDWQVTQNVTVIGITPGPSTTSGTLTP